MSWERLKLSERDNALYGSSQCLPSTLRKLGHSRISSARRGGIHFHLFDAIAFRLTRHSRQLAFPLTKTLLRKKLVFRFGVPFVGLENPERNVAYRSERLVDGTGVAIATFYSAKEA